jgi:hypothetical protein
MNSKRVKDLLHNTVSEADACCSGSDRMESDGVGELEIQKWYVLLDPKKAKNENTKIPRRRSTSREAKIFLFVYGEKKKPHLIKNQLKERSYQKSNKYQYHQLLLRRE